MTEQSSSGCCSNDNNKVTIVDSPEKILLNRLGGGTISDDGPDDDHGATLTYIYLNETTKNRSSWIIHVPKYMQSSSNNDDVNNFQYEWDLHPKKRHIIKLYGKTFYENRWSQAWGYSYKYSGNTNHAKSIKDNSMVKILLNKVNELMNGLFDSNKQDELSLRPYNGCLQNWYEPNDTIGLHSDNESVLRIQYPIVTLSWGGPRRFLLKPRNSHNTTINKIIDMYLYDGDLLIMGGDCQYTHRHEIPKYRKTKDPIIPSNRISWTIRAFHTEETIKQQQQQSINNKKKSVSSRKRKNRT